MADMQGFIARYRECEDILPPLELTRVAEYACSGVLSKDDLKRFLPPGTRATPELDDMDCGVELAEALLVQAKILHQRAKVSEERAKGAESELSENAIELRKLTEKCQQLTTSGREAKDQCWDLELHMQTLNSQIDSLLTANLALSKENSLVTNRLAAASETITQLKQHEQELMESLDASMRKYDCDTENLKKSILKMHEDLNNLDSGYLSSRRCSISSEDDVDDAASAIRQSPIKHRQEAARMLSSPAAYRVRTYETKSNNRRNSHQWEIGQRGTLCSRTLDLGDRMLVQEIIKASPASINSVLSSIQQTNSHDSIEMDDGPGALALPPSPLFDSHSTSTLKQVPSKTNHTISCSPSIIPPRETVHYHDDIANSIQKIMAGEFLYKSSRSLLRQERRSLRFVWVNPQAKYLYWCDVDPGTQRSLYMNPNHSKSSARSAFIRCVRLINDPWSPVGTFPDHHFLPSLSIIIDTPTFSIKLKARSEESHKLWESGLFYLQSTIPTLLSPTKSKDDSGVAPISGIHRGHFVPNPSKNKRMSMFAPRSNW